MAYQAKITDHKAHRKALGLNQVEYWKKVGITQSGGSRYESDRNIPEPVQMLADLVHLPEEKSANTLKELRSNTDTKKRA